MLSLVGVNSFISFIQTVSVSELGSPACDCMLRVQHLQMATPRQLVTKNRDSNHIKTGAFLLKLPQLLTPSRQKLQLAQKLPMLRVQLGYSYFNQYQLVQLGYSQLNQDKASSTRIKLVQLGNSQFNQDIASSTRISQYNKEIASSTWINLV